jgi:hypothetical protein
MAETLPDTIEPYPKISFKLYAERFRTGSAAVGAGGSGSPGGRGGSGSPGGRGGSGSPGGRGPERQRLAGGPRRPGRQRLPRADPRDA